MFQNASASASLNMRTSICALLDSVFSCSMLYVSPSHPTASEGVRQGRELSSRHLEISFPRVNVRGVLAVILRCAQDLARRTKRSFAEFTLERRAQDDRPYLQISS